MPVLLAEKEEAPVVLTILGAGIIAGQIADGQGLKRDFLIEVCDFAVNETDRPSNIEQSCRYLHSKALIDASQQFYLVLEKHRH